MSNQTLDARIAKALADEQTDRAAFIALWQEALDAAAAAELTVATESARALDLENPDPDARDAAVRSAKRTIERLAQATHRIKARVDQIDTDAAASAWRKRADQVEAERDALAAELRELYPAFVGRLAALYDRIDANTSAIGDLHGAAPRGESRRLIDAELAARGLPSYSAEQPRLRDALKLPHFAHPRDIAFPTPPSLNPFAEVMIAAAQAVERKQAGLYGPDWDAARQLQLDQEREESAKRDAALADQQAAQKREYEQSLIENDRRRRLGITEQSHG